MKFMTNRSLSLKLILLFILTAIVMILIIRFTAGNTFVKHFQTSLQPHFYQYFSYINQEIGNPPSLENAKRLSKELNVNIILKGPDFNWSSDESLLDQQENLQLKTHTIADKKYKSGKTRQGFAIQFENSPYITTFLTKIRNSPPPVGKLLLTLLALLCLLYFFIRWMFNPIKDIQKSIKRIGSGEFKHRIAITREDELGKLSTDINAMADDVENMLEAKRQLLLAISHELRSPITRAKVALSLMDDGSLKDGLEGDLSEMETMISGLLEAEKLNYRHQTLNLGEVDINDLVNHITATFYPDNNISQNLADDPIVFQLDKTRIQFAIKNLLSNALKYLKQNDDEVIITTQFSDTDCIIHVEDFGKGIQEKHLPHLTEPFYRADPSRHRETGGYGLGLYIIDKIVSAHQGELIIESTESIGTKVTIKLPIQ